MILRAASITSKNRHSELADSLVWQKVGQAALRRQEPHESYASRAANLGFVISSQTASRFGGAICSTVLCHAQPALL
jgi:hypothetical protein